MTPLLLVKLLRTNWKTALLVVAVASVAGYIGSLRADNAKLRERVATSVQTMTPDEVRKVVQEETGQLVTQVGSLQTTLFRFRDEFGRIAFGRTVEGKSGAQGPAGAQGPPGAPGKPAVPVPGKPDTSVPPPGPAKPLVPPGEAPKAREEATERAYLHFRPGTLLECDAGFGPNVVELLRKPGGALLSTAPCVWKITDVFNLPQVTLRAEAARWKIVAGYGTKGQADFGGAYELVRLGRVSLDAAGLVLTQGLGPGVSYALTRDWTIGPYYLHSFRNNEQQPWILIGRRF